MGLKAEACGDRVTRRAAGGGGGLSKGALGAGLMFGSAAGLRSFGGIQCNALEVIDGLGFGWAVEGSLCSLLKNKLSSL